MNKYLLILPFTLTFFGCSKAQQVQERLPIDQQIKSVVNDKMINVWYPRCIDSINGGFYSDFTFDWKLKGKQDKFIVTQARHVWSLAFLYEHYEQRAEYLKWAEQGFHFLRDHMWDKEEGGFYELTENTGEVVKSGDIIEKRAYGNSFAIYALAQYYKVSHDEEALELAKKAFLWLEKNSHDKEFGGYFQVLNQDGTPIPRAKMGEYFHFEKLQIGLKDFNSSIHLLEAFTTLYQVWPDSLVKVRLDEMLTVVSEKMYDERGFLKLYFYPDWTEVSDDDFEEIIGSGGRTVNHITFGHDVETAFLIYEAAEVLGVPDSLYLDKIKLLVDHPLENGWDEVYGGFYDRGKYMNGSVEIINNHKEWWSQAEALNSFLLMNDLFPNDPRDYYQKFEDQWKYVDTYLIDHEYGGWYIGGLDVDIKNKKANKGSIWKGNYHTIRAMVHCLKRLEGNSGSH